MNSRLATLGATELKADSRGKGKALLSGDAGRILKQYPTGE